MSSPLVESQLVSTADHFFDGSTQLGIHAAEIARGIDTHGGKCDSNGDAMNQNVCLHDLNVVQYNVQTFSDADERKDVMTRLKTQTHFNRLLPRNKRQVQWDQIRTWVSLLPGRRGKWGSRM